MLPGHYQIPAGAVFLAVGLLSCFAGYRLFRAVLTIYGFILGDIGYGILLLIGGLAGAVAMSYGLSALILAGFVKVLLALFSAPVLGLLSGYAFMSLTKLATQNASPRVNWFFRRVQPFNVIALGLSHGSNDGQLSRT